MIRNNTHSRALTILKCACLSIVLSLLLIGVLPCRIALALDRPIALDCGHGGNDEGAYNSNFVEREMNWVITLACKAELERMGYRVVIVNTINDNYSLAGRAQRAVNCGSPVLISIHNNAWDGVSPEKRGSTVLVPNASSYEYEFYPLGQQFAQTVTNGLYSELGMPVWKDGSYERDFPDGSSSSYYPDGSVSDYYGIVRQSRLRGIFGVIIEHGFIDNSQDAQIYWRAGSLERMGIADAHAIAHYYDDFVSCADAVQARRVSTGQWVESGNRRWYRYADGSYPAGRMVDIDGATYGFDNSGWMVTGWYKYGSYWYWFEDSGHLAKDRLTDDGYYVDDDGIWADGAPSKPVALSAGGGKWIRSGDRYWFRHDDGVYTVSGWERIDGSWYLFDPYGWMRTGWAKLGPTWYYLSSSGAMATGWAKVDGTWYYLRNSGEMATGWIKDRSNWYFLKSSGAMATGWLKDGGKWYYLAQSGAMYSSRWVKSSGKWYYLGQDGVMLTSCVTPDGYTVDKNGVWVA